MPEPAEAGEQQPFTVRDYLTQQAVAVGIPPELALAMVTQESGGKQGAVSPKGAVGLFQLMPETAEELGVDPTDPFQNIEGGLRYFKQQLDAHDGNVKLALAAYNAGPGAVKQAGGIPNFPETRQYVTSIMERWMSGGGAPPAGQSSAQVPPAPSTPAPQTATAPPLPPTASPSLRERYLNLDKKVGETVSGLVTGGMKGLGELAIGAGEVVAPALRKIPGVRDYVATPEEFAAAREQFLTPEGTAEEVGKFGAEVASYAVPAAKVTKLAKALPFARTLTQAGVNSERAALVARTAVEAAGQAATAAGVASLGGEEDDIGTVATVAAAAPIAGALITAMAPVIRQTAIRKLSRFMERGVSKEITPERQQQLAQAASDMIELPLRRTWRQMADMTRGIKTRAGESLGRALEGPLGDVRVPLAPVRRALTDLVDEATHLIPVKGGFRGQEFKPGTGRAVDELLGALEAYGDEIPARQLHDIKQVWWKTIYPQKEAALPITATRELLTNAQKEAHMRGAATIAEVFEQQVPDLARYDEAVKHAARLNTFVQRLATKQRTGNLATRVGQGVASSVGAATGFGAGLAMGHPFIGAAMGGAAARVVLRAIESPRWRLIPMVTRRRLADAIARGDADRALKIATPIMLAATAEQDNLLSPQNRNRFDLPSTDATAAR